MSSTLKIIVDIQCLVYCDFEQVGEAFPNSMFKIELRKGSYIISFNKEGCCLKSMRYTIESNDEDFLLEISLASIYAKEKEELKRKKISEKNVTWIDVQNHWRLLSADNTPLNPSTGESWIDLPNNYVLLPMGQHWDSDIDECGYIPFNIGGTLWKGRDGSPFISEGKWGCLDKTGKVTIQPIYESKVFFHNDKVTAIYDRLTNNNSIIIDYQGNEVFTKDYDRVFPIDEVLGLYEVEKQHKCGIIDKYGDIVVPLNYSKFSYHTKNLIWAQEQSTSKWGLILFDSTIKQPFVYDKILRTNEGYYVSCGNKWGSIDDNGNAVINTLYTEVARCQYREIKSSELANSDDDEFDYYNYTIVKRNGKYGVVNTNFYESLFDKNRPLIFKEIIPCKYDALYSLSGTQHTAEELAKQASPSYGCPDGSFRMPNNYFVENINNHMQCDKYDNDCAIIYSFVCDEFNDRYKILSEKYYLRNKQLEYESDSFDLIRSIDFYDGTIQQLRVPPKDWDGFTCPSTMDIIRERSKVSYLIGKKDAEWYIFNKHNELLFTCKCDKILEFGYLCHNNECFAIVEIESFHKLFIIDDAKVVYESDYMVEIHSSYNELTNSKIANNDEYLIDGLSSDYFIVHLKQDKWQVLVYVPDFQDFNIFKSPKFDFIRFVNEGVVEVQIHHNGRTLYNTMSTECWEDMKPTSVRWKVSPYDERTCNWVAVYDFDTDKEGIVIEEHDELEEDNYWGGNRIVGKIPEEIIIPFEWDYARMFNSDRNPIIVVGNYTYNKVGVSYGMTKDVKCAIMDTNQIFLSNFIFNKISTGKSCQDLCFHIGNFMADVNLAQDNLIYSIPFLNYECYENDKRLIKSPFGNVKLFVDTEATGLPLNQKEPYTNLENWPYLVLVTLIIEDDNFGILAKRSIILKPDGYSIPESSSKIHGITNDMAKRKGEDRKMVISFLDTILYNSDVIIGHNVSFDINVIKAEIIRVKGAENALFIKKEHNIIDTMKLGVDICKITNLSSSFRQTIPYKYPTLDELYYKLYNKHFDNQHNAMSNIQATYDCYYRLIQSSQ